ncbi:MAG: protoheme IX farnesyltransferase, partial [Planctomycetota bacterium]
MSQLTDTSPATRTADDAYTPSPFDPVNPPSADLPAEPFVKTPTAWNDYKTLTKPRITRMVVITAAIGFVFGVANGAAFPWLTLVIAMAGTALSCMAASVFNQVMELDTDALMERTKNRPVAAGRINAKPAIVLGSLLTVAGLGLLVGFGLYLAAALCAFTIASYALIYTPLKRRTSLALLIGAVPGALPPMIGYAAAAGDLGPAAWLLFA